MSEKFTRINTALIPSKEVIDEMVSLSKEVSDEYETEFTLDNKNFFPHVTVYSPEYPVENVGDIKKVVGYIARMFKPFEIALSDIEVEDGYIVLNLKETEELDFFHFMAVSALNGFRNGRLRDKYLDVKYLATQSEERRENIFDYGYPNVLALWKPHITLTKFRRSEEAEIVAEDLDLNLGNVSFKELGLFEMGKNGTCVKLIDSFDLTGFDD